MIFLHLFLTVVMVVTGNDSVRASKRVPKASHAQRWESASDGNNVSKNLSIASSKMKKVASEKQNVAHSFAHTTNLNICTTSTVGEDASKIPKTPSVVDAATPVLAVNKLETGQARQFSSWCGYTKRKCNFTCN